MLHRLLVLCLLGVALGPAAVSAPVREAEHVSVARVECAAWVPAGAVLTLTAECGDATTYARDARTLLESGYYGLGTATADKEVCAAHWTSGGVVVEIAVPKKLGETQDEWLDRCKQAVEKAKIQFPPEP